MDELNENEVVEPEQAETVEEPDYKAMYEAEKANAEKWKALSRKNEARYKEATSAADSSDEVRELKQQLETMQHDKQIADWRKTAMDSNGLSDADAAWVTGTTEDEINASAAAFKARLDAIPKGPEMGNVGGVSAKPVTKQDILSIKNEKERLRAIAANAELFN